MSNRIWKRARREARVLVAEARRQHEAMLHLPGWRRLAHALGWKAPARRWAAVWARRMARAERRTVKEIAGLRIQGIAGGQKREET